jgi:hypothetical protein
MSVLPRVFPHGIADNSQAFENGPFSTAENAQTKKNLIESQTVGRKKKGRERE